MIWSSPKLIIDPLSYYNPIVEYGRVRFYFENYRRLTSNFEKLSPGILFYTFIRQLSVILEETDWGLKCTESDSGI